MKYFKGALLGGGLGFSFGVAFIMSGSLLSDSIKYKILQLTFPPFNYVPFGFMIEYIVLGAIIGFVIVKSKKTGVV